MPLTQYDLIIVGAGPAGYTASIYASRYKIANLVIGEVMGGLIGESYKVCNYPTEDEIPGLELMAKMQRHAKNLGADEMLDLVLNIVPAGGGFSVTTAKNGEIFAKAVLLANGLKHRKLNIPGEAEFTHKGVAYCATCDGSLFYDKQVAVIGGSDSAVSSAVYLSDIAKQVYLIYRKDKLRCEPAWAELAEKKNNIKIIYSNNVRAIMGNKFVHSLELDRPYQGEKKLPIDGIFVEIGSEPSGDLTQSLRLSTDEAGFIKVKKDQSSSHPGIFAAGDITDASDQFCQVVTACSEGAIAARGIFNYLAKTESSEKSERSSEPVFAASQ